MQIEANIPVPAEYVDGRHTKRKYPFHDMQVGDSFFVPASVQRSKIVRNAAEWHANRYGKRMIVRVETDPTGVDGCRVWRTE